MKVHLRMLGCRLNQAEIDTMARQFQQQGHEISTDPGQADQIVVNTCVVTQNAAKDSRKLIRELHRRNGNAEITVTGCYAQISPNELSPLPGVVQIVDNTGKDTLVERMTGVAVEPFDDEPISRETRPGVAGRTRAFVKVQDGCDNTCTFCITTVARGKGHSRALAAILDEIRCLHRAGLQEVVLTGVHLGSYGHDLGDMNGLVKLVRSIIADTDIPRLRLSSLEPWDLSPEFFDLWESPRVCKHLHLPLQSGCDATLKRMLRRTSQVEYRQLVQAARDRIPGLSITTDMIVGFPGETGSEFDTSAAFVEEMAFSRLHIFRYSKRPGTAAARMKNQVDSASKKARSGRLHALAAMLSQQFAENFGGQTRTVLWEQVTGSTEAGFVNVGYTDNYIRVRGIHPRVLTNHITPAQMLKYDAVQGQMTAKPILS